MALNKEDIWKRFELYAQDVLNGDREAALQNLFDEREQLIIAHKISSLLISRIVRLEEELRKCKNE